MLLFSSPPLDPYVNIFCRYESKPEMVEVKIIAATKESDSLFSTDGLENWAYNETGVEPEDLERAAGDLAPAEVVALDGNEQSLVVRGTEVKGSSDALILVAGGDGSAEALSAVAEAVQFD